MFLFELDMSFIDPQYTYSSPELVSRILNLSKVQVSSCSICITSMFTAIFCCKKSKKLHFYLHRLQNQIHLVLPVLFPKNAFFVGGVKGEHCLGKKLGEAPSKLGIDVLFWPKECSWRKSKNSYITLSDGTVSVMEHVIPFGYFPSGPMGDLIWPDWPIPFMAFGELQMSTEIKLSFLKDVCAKPFCLFPLKRNLSLRG